MCLYQGNGWCKLQGMPKDSHAVTPPCRCRGLVHHQRLSSVTKLRKHRQIFQVRQDLELHQHNHKIWEDVSISKKKTMVLSKLEHCTVPSKEGCRKWDRGLVTSVERSAAVCYTLSSWTFHRAGFNLHDLIWTGGEIVALLLALIFRSGLSCHNTWQAMDWKTQNL